MRFDQLAITLLITLTLWSSPGLAKGIKVQTLADHVYAISLMNYTSLVVVGDKDVLITDTANPYRATLLRQQIAKLTNKPVKKIVLSHEHFDHVGGTHIFPEAEIIAQRNIREYDAVDPLDMVPDVIHQTFESKMTIDMGHTQVELLHMGIADGAAVAIVYLPKEKIALSADMYVDEGFGPGVYLTDTNLLGNRLILNKLASWELKYAINVHSERTDLEPLQKTAGFLNDLYSTLLPKIKTMMEENPSQLVSNILEMSQTLDMPAYKHWANYKDLPIYIRKMSFAMIHGG